MQRWLHILAQFLLRNRAAVLVLTLLATLGLGLQIPKLKADFTPSDLFAKFDDQSEIAAEFQKQFGNTDNILLVLVTAPDVLAPEVLGWVHELSNALQNQPFVARVDSLTEIPIPRTPTAAELDKANSSAVAATTIVGQMLVEKFRRLPTAVRGGEFEPARVPAVPERMLGMIAGRGAVRSVVDGDAVTAEGLADLRVALDGSRLLDGRLISRDRTMTVVAVSLNRELTRNDNLAEAVGLVDNLLAAMRAPPGVEVHQGGLPFIRTRVIQNMRADQSVLLPASLGICIVILMLSFRWVPALVLPTLAVVISAVALVGAMAAWGEPFNIINNIVPLLIIIIGISNSIHFVSRYAEEIRNQREKHEALERTLVAMTVACFLTSFTTAVGFGTLIVSRTDLLQRFGVVAGLGVMLSYVVSLTFLPAALSYLKPPPVRSIESGDGWLETMVEKTTRLVLRHHKLVLLGTLVSALGAGYAATGIRVDSAVLDQFDKSDPIYLTTRLVEEKLSGVRPLEVYLSADTVGAFDDPAVLNALDRLATWAKQQDGVLGTMSYADYLHEVAVFRHGAEARGAEFTSRAEVETNAALLSSGARNPLAPWVSEDRRHARLNLGIRDFGAKATIALANRLEVEVNRELAAFPHVRARLTGDAYMGSRGLESVISDFLGSLGLAVVIIFLFMAVLFRSARLAALSVPPNIIPLVGTLGVMAMFDIPLNAATAIIFSISIGMAVDGSIHILARFGEESLTAPNVDEALVRAARGTGRAIVMTCFSLMAGFGVMLASSFVPVRLFGELVALTVLGCLIATIIVLPALLKAGGIALNPNIPPAAE